MPIMEFLELFPVDFWATLWAKYKQNQFKNSNVMCAQINEDTAQASNRIDSFWFADMNQKKILIREVNQNILLICDSLYSNEKSNQIKN